MPVQIEGRLKFSQQEQYRETGIYPITPPLYADGSGSPAGYPYPQHGISVRLWLAGMAMQGLLAGGELDVNHKHERFKSYAETYAKDALILADAMIAAAKVKP